MSTSPFILTVTGPSCAGKSTLAERLKAAGWASTRSFTTRAPRPGERDGVHYDFRDQAWFQQEYEAGHIVEFTVHAGAMYGTTADALRHAATSGRPVVSVLDPNGVVNLRKACGTSMTIASLYLNPPRRVVLERLFQRYAHGGGDDEHVALTLATRIRAYLNVECLWLTNFFPHFDCIAREYAPDTEDDILGFCLSAAGLRAAPNMAT